MGTDDHGRSAMENEVIMAWQRVGLVPPPERINDFVDLYTGVQKTLQRLQEQMDFSVQPAVSYRFPANYLESEDHVE